MPPACASRSITTTVPAPERRSVVAAARPAGPPPTTATSTSAGKASSAVEALAAAHGRPRAAAQPVEVGGRDRAGVGVADLAPGDPLAEADDLAVGRVGGDAVRLRVR